MREFFAADQNYREDLLQYSKIDAGIAIIFYAVYMGAYYWMGRLYAEQQIYRGVSCNLLLVFTWLLLLLGWHILFNFLYRKYNSILAGTMFHGFLDLGNSLFL